MQPSDIVARLPITFATRTGPTVSGAIYAVLATLIGLVTIYGSLPMLPGGLGVFVFLAGLLLATFHGYLILRLFYSARLPNALVIGREGVSITFAGKQDFVAWSDIAAIQFITYNLIVGPSVVLALTPNAIIRRYEARGSTGLSQNFVSLGFRWQDDGREIKSRELADMIERCWQALKGAPTSAK